MTKAELLMAIAAKDFISSVGAESLLETKPDGTKLYNVNVREVKDTVGVYRNVAFYVVDEGGPGESAFFKDIEPQQNSRVSALRQWMFGTVDSSPDDFKAVQVHWVSERWGMVVYSILEDDGASGLAWQTYYVRKGAGAPKKISNHEIWRIASIAQV